MKQFDYSSLQRPASLAEVRHYIPYLGTLTKAVTFIVLTLIMLCLFIPDDTLYVVTVVMVLFAPILILMVYNSGRTTARIGRFAKLNDIPYRYYVSDPNYKGIMFEVGNTRTINQALVIKDEKLTYEIGEYQYTVGTGKSQRVLYTTYIKIPLRRNLPHIVLDGKKNDFLGISTLPVFLSKKQKLSLEGNFDKYYTLYAPKNYEADALYVFTPDVMESFIKCGYPIDVEIIDNELYIYIMNRLALDRPQNIKFLMHLADTLGRRVDNQTDYYKDDAIMERSADVVAEPGKRLALSNVPLIIFTVVSIISVIAYLANKFFSLE